MYTDDPASGETQEAPRVLSPTQLAFAICREPFPAFVGGYGSGKSAAGIARAMALKTQFRENDIAYYLPTYPLIEDIAFQRFPELCERKGWAYKLHKSGGNPQISFPGAGRIIFRSMEKPERIIGYEVAHSIVDELDTLTKEKARKVWIKIIARNRQKIKGLPKGVRFANTVAVATTPEGFNFVWEQWVKKALKGYVLFHASTYDNRAHLPDGYIENLETTYPEQLLEAYLNGLFTNLTSGSVYNQFDRTLNASGETIQKGDALHIGLDFNIGKMAAAIHVMRNGWPHAVAEKVKVFDTTAMVRLLKRDYPDHQILIYPDASGDNRSTTSGISDFKILKDANFRLVVNEANPRVRDRVNSFNALIYQPRRPVVRAYRVNPDTCPNLVESLEKQAYDKNGEPDKTSDFDHIVDAAGYFVYKRYPLLPRPAMGSFNLQVATNG